MFRKLVLLTALLTVSGAASARADTFYGGTAVRNGVQKGAAVALAVRADGSVVARAHLTYGCVRFRIYNVVVPMKGRVSGQAVSATGKIRRPGARTIRYTLTGTLTPDAITGRLKLTNHCGSPTRDLVLRAMATPAGAPIAAPRATSLYGVTGQTGGGVHPPVFVRVAGNGRVRAFWSARMKCGGGRAIINNSTPSTKVKPDGTFSRHETFTVRYADGSRERYRVRFAGRFLADGAVGTLRARMQFHKGKAHYPPCDSGVQTWEVRP